MDYRKLTRNPQLGKQNLVKLPDKTVFTKVGCRVIFPVCYAEHQLAFIGEEVQALGILAVIFPETGQYTVMNVPSLMKMSPAVINVVKIFDEDYYELLFDPNTPLFTTTQLVVDDVMPYRIYKYFVAHGRIPWYLDFLDVTNLFLPCTQYCKVSLAANEAVMSLVASDVARNPTDPGQKFCTTIQSIEERNKQRPYWVPFTDIQYGATNTTAKMMGNYADLAVVSALVNPSQRLENIEELLRQ